MENNYFDSKILEEILNIPSPTGYTKYVKLPTERIR